MLATAGLRDQDVGRLDVAVDEILLVRRVERLGDLGEELDRSLGGERTVLGNELREVVALDVAHGEEEDTAIFARLVDGDDVGMVERGRDPRLAQEALAEALVLGELGGDHLERDLAPETLLLGAVDRTHPSAADERFDPVAGDRRSGRQHGARDVAHESSVRDGSAECNIRCLLAASVTTVTFARRARGRGSEPQDGGEAPYQRRKHKAARSMPHPGW